MATTKPNLDFAMSIIFLGFVKKSDSGPMFWLTTKIPYIFVNTSLSVTQICSMWTGTSTLAVDSCNTNHSVPELTNLQTMCMILHGGSCTLSGD